MLESRPTRREEGFSLIEMVVVLMAATIVMAALFTIIDGTLHGTTRTFSKVDATQRARTTFEEIENELHSACVVGEVTPIEPGSTGSSLSFVSQYGNAASPTPTWHVISMASGTLTDSSYSVSGSAPNWTQGSLLGTTTLLTNVSQSGSTPVFQYFAFQQISNGSGGYYTDGAGNPYMVLPDGTDAVPGTSPPVLPFLPLSTPLSTSDAQDATEVLLTLVVGPSGGTNENTSLSDANATVTDSIGLRLTPPANHVEAGATFGPCE